MLTAMVPGWTLEYISGLTIPQVRMLQKGWEKYPSAAAVLAAMRTRGKSSKGAAATQPASDHRELAGIFGGGKSIVDQASKKGS